MQPGLRAVNPAPSWEPEGQGLVFLSGRSMEPGNFCTAGIYKDLLKRLKNTQAWTRSLFITVGRRCLQVPVKVNENKDIMHKTTF